MDLATIVGFISFFALFAMALESNNMALESMWDLPSFLIVFGGTLSFVLISNPLTKITALVGVFKQAFFSRTVVPSEVIADLVKYAEVARREGILALEKTVEETEDAFLSQGMRLAVDGTDPELLMDILETERQFIAERHTTGRSIVETMSEAAPAFGLIGTLLGLIAMLTSLNDPTGIGPGMALALKTTLYGVLLGTAFLKPIASKLKTRSEDELLIKDLIIEGIMGIQSGDNPRSINTKLQVFLAPRDRSLDARTQED